MSFLCSRIPQKLYWFAIISWFTSLNRIFIWLSNDNKLEYILPILYSKWLKKKPELCETGPERCCLTLTSMASIAAERTKDTDHLHVGVARRVTLRTVGLEPQHLSKDNRKTGLKHIFHWNLPLRRLIFA